MPLRPWKTKSSREVYRNRWMSVREDLAEMPDGRETIYGVITTGECVGVLPFLDASTVVMTRQYRYVSRRLAFEMPTGAMHEGESREAAALVKDFRGFRAVNGVELKVRRGAVHALIGPNGAGKTTVFNLLTKFLEPTSGRIS